MTSLGHAAAEGELCALTAEFAGVSYPEASVAVVPMVLPPSQPAGQDDDQTICEQTGEATETYHYMDFVTELETFQTEIDCGDGVSITCVTWKTTIFQRILIRTDWKQEQPDGTP